MKQERGGVDENGNLFYTILIDEKNSSIDSNKETKSEPIDEAINVIISQTDSRVKIVIYLICIM